MMNGKNIVSIIGRVGVGLFLVCFAACASQAPLDDAYHWEDRAPKHTKTDVQPTPIVNTTETKPVETKSVSPAMEIVNQQDTTITIRIKK